MIAPGHRPFGPHVRVHLPFLLGLTALALLTRGVWVLEIHPPWEFVFSDMDRYVERAQRLATHGFEPESRELAWQAFGTHYLLALPLWVFGPDELVPAAVAWALMGAAIVPLSYLLACRVCRSGWAAMAVGVVTLLWLPSVTNNGFFLSEIPFGCFQLWSTLWLVTTLQEGRRAWGAGLVSAVVFALRPQSALFFLLVFVTWLVNRRQLPQVRPHHLGRIALPLLLALAFSFWRFQAHTGYCCGVAENANMNLTAGRCHNIVTQAFRSDAQLRRSERRRNTRDGRRVSLPGFRVLARSLPDQHPLGLRPALGGESIRMVGYIGDPDIHRGIRRSCYAKTGFWGQVRYSVVNASLLWFIGRQWPEIEGDKRMVPYLEFYKYVFQVVFWLPSLLGVGYAIALLRRRPELALVAWQIVTSTVIASIFFGTIRLRTPYDPYAFILTAEVFTVLASSLQAWLGKRRAS